MNNNKYLKSLYMMSQSKSIMENITKN